MKAMIILATGLLLSVNAHATTYAEETCDALHQIKPASVHQQIAVTCRWPTKTTHFICKSADKKAPVIDAEAFDERCVSPWAN